MLEAYQTVLQALLVRLKQYKDQGNITIIEETLLKFKQQAFTLENDFDKDGYCCAYLTLRSLTENFTLPVVRDMLEICFLRAELNRRNAVDSPDVLESSRNLSLPS